MKIVYKNIWSAWEDNYYIVIPTNGFVKTNGECVMGRGLALQAKEKFPQLPLELGKRIVGCGNDVFIFLKYRLLTFPVKTVWYEKAKLELIEKSCKQLEEIFKYNLFDLPVPLYLPRVGCGNGKLNWDEVKPILEKYLDDRFIVCIWKFGEVE